MEQANDVWIDLRMAGVNSSEANILPHVERIAAALDAAFAEGKRQSNGATQEQLRQARAEERERCAKVADQAAQAHQRVGQNVSAKRFSALALHIRALSSEAPAPTEGEGER
jgi:oligoribonuclease (3'-5' exoribonuclease)